MSNKIICYSCNKQIKTNEDLVTAPRFFHVRPYHGKCYSAKLKSLSTIIIGNRPINSDIATFGVVISALIAIYILREFIRVLSMGFSSGKTLYFIIFIVIMIILLLLLLSLIYWRLYSYYKFEKPLNK